MKLVWDEGERERIIDSFKEGHMLFPANGDPVKEYSVNFKVTQPEIAEYVLLSLVHGRLNLDIGIDITSINFDKYRSHDELKARIIQVIERM